MPLDEHVRRAGWWGCMSAASDVIWMYWWGTANQTAPTLHCPPETPDANHAGVRLLSQSIATGQYQSSIVCTWWMLRTSSVGPSKHRHLTIMNRTAVAWLSSSPKLCYLTYFCVRNAFSGTNVRLRTEISLVATYEKWQTKIFYLSIEDTRLILVQ